MDLVRRAGAKAKLRVERARAQYGWFDVVMQTGKRYSADDGGFYAAGLTYFAFFSIFPLILFATSALGFATFLSPELRQDLITTGAESFPLLRGLLKPESLDTIENARLSLAVTALVLALYSGTGGIVSLQHALNRIYRVQDEGGFLGKRLTAVGFLMGLGALVVGSVALGAVGEFIGGPATRLATVIGGLATSVGIFVVSFWLLPRRRSMGWREVVPGAIVAGVVFELLKGFGAIYLRSGQESRNQTFGAFATAAALLVSSYLLCQITLLAAELNAVLAERRTTRQFSLADRSKEAM